MPGSSDSLASQSLSMRAAPDADVQRDWEERELTHAIQLGIKKLTQFLNDFDSTTRDKLAALNGKIARMDRRMALVEATLDSVNEAPPT